MHFVQFNENIPFWNWLASATAKEKAAKKKKFAQFSYTIMKKVSQIRV